MVEYACVYCGLVGDSVDHVPPTSVRPTLLHLGLASQYPFQEVRACRECNVGLGARPLWTIGQRRAFIKTWLERRYRKYLKIPAWSDSELGQMDVILRDFVIHSLAVKAVIERRIRY